ncbi:hypothetical protein C5689_05070 [Methylosinus sporium]|uniref:DUF1640 domain-containing protein n=2 Tax=Methylosinus sporium TaxID=428 RepID=A0A2U1ST92_METSR|nr:hypothetical protein C5689_05070 [Methylosinus sporium]
MFAGHNARKYSEGYEMGLAEILPEIDGSQLTTKSDLTEAVADLKVDILRWLVVTQLAVGGFIFAAIKFMR